MSRENLRNKKVEYISLQEATKYCPYSQEYLSLRARQGKLKAIKIGRNWVTKKEWVKEYLQEMEKFATKKRIAKNKSSSRFWEKEYPRSDITKAKVQQKETNLPYQVLPASESNQQYKKESLAGKGTKKEKNFFFSLSFKSLKPLLAIFLLALICTTLFFTVNYWLKPIKKEIVFLGGFSFSVTKESFSFFVQTTKRGITNIFAKIANPQLAGNFGEKLSSFLSSIKNSLNKLFKRFSLALDFGISKTKKAISQASQKLISVFKKEQVVKKEIKPEKELRKRVSEKPSLLPSFSKKGLVVLPKEKIQANTVEQIKKAFSDQVKVEPKDEMSGIIIPIFREREGQQYFYILVPINQ